MELFTVVEENTTEKAILDISVARAMKQRSSFMSIEMNASVKIIVSFLSY